jgi:ribosomal protein S18 acetylase RimI-like enzyme
MQPAAEVDRISIDTAGAAAMTLARAFADDPVFMWMARGRALPESKSVGGFRAVINGELRKAEPELFVAEGGGSVAIWHGIDAWKGSAGESIRLLPTFVRIFGLGVGRVLRTITIMERVHPTAPHYHLAYVGTDPSRQGRGLGSAVLRPMLDRCDIEGVPAYLENSKPRNEAFYARHGFVATGPLPLPAGAPPVIAMWREPRSH